MKKLSNFFRGGPIIGLDGNIPKNRSIYASHAGRSSDQFGNLYFPHT